VFVGSILRKGFIFTALLAVITLSAFSGGTAATQPQAHTAVRLWTFSGPPAGPVNVFASQNAVGTVTYAGGQGGVWKTLDGGEHWQSLPGSPGQVRFMVVDPTTSAVVYAATETRIYKSANGGAAWSMIFHVPHEDPSFYRVHDVTGLVINPHERRNLYVSTAASGLFRSDNAGETWAHVPSVFSGTTDPVTLLRSLSIDPFIPSTLYAGSYRSLDAGLTFEDRGGETGGPSYAAYPEPDAQNIVYGTSQHWGFVGVGGFCLGTWSRFIKSTTGGSLYFDIGPTYDFWNGCNANVIWPPPNYYSIYSIVAHSCIGYNVLISAGGEMYSGTSIYPYRDGGVYRVPLWEKVNTGLGNGLHRLVGGPLGLVCASSGAFVGMASGVYRSDNAGSVPVTWQAKNAGLTNSVVTSLAVADDASRTVYAGTAGSGIYRSLDRGVNWFAANSGISTRDQQPIVGGDVHKVFALAVDRFGHVYAATNNGMYYSHDSGAHWSLTGMAAATSVILVPGQINTAYAYGLECSSSTSCTGKIYVTTDAGQTWIGVVSPATGSPLNLLATGAANTPLYALVSTDGLYKGMGGSGWVKMSDVDFCSTANPCMALAADAHTAGRVYIGAKDGLYASTNSGDTFSPLAFGGMPVNGVTVDPTNSTVYVVLGNGTTFVSSDGGLTADYSSGGLYQSTDGGVTWSNFNLPVDRSINAVALDPANGNLFVGTQGMGAGAGKMPAHSLYLPDLVR